MTLHIVSFQHKKIEENMICQLDCHKTVESLIISPDFKPLGSQLVLEK